MVSKKTEQKILVGFNGDLESVVSAYLLKRQGHDVFAIGICFHSIEDDEVIKNRYDEKGAIIDKTPFQGIHVIDDIEKVKSIADALEIPFFAVAASKEYQAQITDKVVAARLGGRTFSPEIESSKLIFEILMQKCQKLEADKIATGHYAKVLSNDSSGKVDILVSNDLENDQSFLLSKVPREVLKKIYLPLSDMRVLEVQKIAKSLKLEFLPKKNNSEKFMHRNLVSSFVADRSPPIMIKEGNIIDYKSESILGDHTGIHQFCVGQVGIKTSGNSNSGFDKTMTVISSQYHNGVVYLAQSDELFFNIAYLDQVEFSEGIDLSAPLEIYIPIEKLVKKKNKEKTHINNENEKQKKEDPESKKRMGHLYPYNNNFCEITFPKLQEGMCFPGQTLTFYSRSGAMGKVIGSGVVVKCGIIENDIIRSFPKRKEEDDEDEEVQNIDIYSFKF